MGPQKTTISNAPIPDQGSDDELRDDLEDQV